MPLVDTKVKGVWIKADETLTCPFGAGVQTIAGSVLSQDLSGQKFRVTVAISTASTVNGSPDLRVLSSHDNATFDVVIAAASLTLDSTSTSSTDQATLDASALTAPYWKIELFTDGTNTTDAWAGDVTVVYLDPRVNRNTTWL